MSERGRQGGAATDERVQGETVSGRLKKPEATSPAHDPDQRAEGRTLVTKVLTDTAPKGRPLASLAPHRLLLIYPQPRARLFIRLRPCSRGHSTTAREG